MSTSNARDRSNHPAALTLRPRNKRLISGLDDDYDASGSLLDFSTARNPSPAPGQLSSRSASPIPPAHPQRTRQRHPQAQQANGPLDRHVTAPTKTGGHETQLFANIWGHSWNALQGIASDLLGNEPDVPSNTDRTRVRRPIDRRPPQTASSGAPAMLWGPAGSQSKRQSDGIGGGSTEEQMAALRARKKRDMLTGAQSSRADTLGKFKRRLSDDRASLSAPPSSENDNRDAMVYVHHVAKDDTLAGITIRYKIALNALRQANRMWPNDTIQSRQVLMLPVDACGVKGRPCLGPDEEEDLLVAESESLSTLHAQEIAVSDSTAATPTLPAPTVDRDRARSISTNASSSQPASSAVDHQPLWHHDSWVLLPGSTTPTEIARLPRRALGYFPPARRKSRTFSDLDTPVTSIELRRSDDLLALDPPSQDVPPRHSPRGRRASNAMNGYFSNFLSGPGGVGTMSSNVKFPGPAQDGLNRMFAKHLPDVAPPRHHDALLQPDLPLYSDDVTPLPSGSSTPAYPHNVRNGKGAMKLENVGGAIESWVRRFTAKTQTPLADSQQAARVSVGTSSKGAGGIGDLIEMTDEFEIGADDDDPEEDQRGRAGSTSLGLLSQPTTHGNVVTSGHYSDTRAVLRAGSAGRGKGTKNE